MGIKLRSSLVWCFICVIIALTFVPRVWVNTDSQMQQDRGMVSNLVENWEIAFGEEKPEEADWLPMDSEAKALLNGYEGTVWMQRPMPDEQWRVWGNWENPYLIFSWVPSFEAYLDGELILSFNENNQLQHLIPEKLIHPVRIDADYADKHLLIRAQWQGEALYGPDMALIGELDQFLYLYISTELAFLIYGILIVTVGCIGVVMFIQRKDRIFGWFALFCIAMGCTLLLVCRTLQWFIDMKELYYWGALCTPIGIWACLSFYLNALNIGKYLYTRIVHVVLGIYIVLLTLIAIFKPLLYRELTFVGNAFIGIIVFTTIAIALAQYAYHRRRKPITEDTGTEWRWLLRGCWTFGIGALISVSMYTFFPEQLMEDLLKSHDYPYRVIEGLLPNSLLLFFICMVMVTVGRVQRIYRDSERNAAELLVKNKELEQFHRNLEQLVEQRTSELEQANRSLAVTMREKAETLADISVLEERNRIAYEMHDVVGHTLTAAIVQLEATRKLHDREGSISLDRLELLDDLVRKGLDDIRRAVRLMKSDEEEQQLTFEESIRELIQFAEDTMDCKVDSDIMLPRELPIGKVTESVLYSALQEGLTNGIRHGHSSSFKFKLHGLDTELRFLLISDGEPYQAEALGFGLSSMLERVELLGGTVSLRPSTDGEGTPVGCELEIVIPLS